METQETFHTEVVSLWPRILVSSKEIHLAVSEESEGGGRVMTRGFAGGNKAMCAFSRA